MASANNSSPIKSYYLLLVIVFGGFFVFGFSENVKGPALPRMQSEFFLDEMQVGLLLSLNSLGYLLACSFTGFLSRKAGLKFTTMLALGSMAVSGVLMFLSFNYPFLTASYFLLYIGNGILEIGLAILAARIFTKNTGTMMNLSHFFYGLSSTVAPILASGLMGMTLFGATIGWRGMYLVMLSLSVLPMIPSLFSKFPGDDIKESDRISFKQYVRDPAAWFMVAILSLGVVSELAVGGWLVNFLEKAYKWDTVTSSGMLSAFFLLFMLSRLFLGPVTDKIGFIKSLIILSGFSGICTLAAIIAGEPGAFLFALAGAGIAPVYPTVMAFLAKRYPNGSETAISFTVTLMGIACVSGNFLIGAIIDLFESIFKQAYGNEAGLRIGLQAGYTFIGLCAVFCSVISVLMYRYLKKRKEVI